MKTKSIPFRVAGSTMFGRYPKISTEQTFNFILSDDWMVPSAGYANVATISPSGQGRGIYASSIYQHMILVIDNLVYTVNKNLAVTLIASIDTTDGDVFIDENNGSQIAICDKKNIYIFDYSTNTFSKAALDFLPGYVCFQDTYFIAPDLKNAQWRLSGNNDGLSWPDAPSSVGSFQTKPDRPVAAIKVPGRGNMLYVFGSIVTESWNDLGYQLFPYQKNTYYNIDYGTLNPATIAANDQIVVWLGANEKSGPVIMYTQGGQPQQISTDGINFKLAEIKYPQNSYGFLFKQDGHQIYQFTFPDDNLSYQYDFETGKFFTVTDQYMNFHIAKRVVAFNNSYYFVSFTDGNLYELNSKYTTYNGAEIPRVRVCENIRTPDSTRFIVNDLTFTLEHGNSQGEQAIDCSFSHNGGESFSSYERRILNKLGRRPNKLDFWNLGMANDFVPQFRFWGFDRFVISNGLASIYQ